MWFVGTQVHFFTFRKESTLSQNALPFKVSSILRRSFSLHSVFRFVSHLTIFASESRESYSLPFLYIFSLLRLLFSPEFYFQSCLCYGENIRTPPFLVRGYVSAWTISR